MRRVKIPDNLGQLPIDALFESLLNLTASDLFDRYLEEKKDSEGIKFGYDVIGNVLCFLDAISGSCFEEGANILLDENDVSYSEGIRSYVNSLNECVEERNRNAPSFLSQEFPIIIDTIAVIDPEAPITWSFTKNPVFVSIMYLNYLVEKGKNVDRFIATVLRQNYRYFVCVDDGDNPKFSLDSIRKEFVDRGYHTLTNFKCTHSITSDLDPDENVVGTLSGFVVYLDKGD